MTTITEEEYAEADRTHQGFCENCGEFTNVATEPSARNNVCKNCGQPSVFGAEEALLMGLITFPELL